MNYNIPVRLAQLRNRHVYKHYIDIIRELHEKGIRVSQSDFSLWINGIENPPRSAIVMQAADEVVAGWEHDAERN